MDKEKLSIVLMSMKSSIAIATKKLKSFETDLKNDAAHAFEWATSAMEAAAIVDVYGRVIEALTKKDATATPASMYEYAMEQVMNKARYPAHGSSSSSNTMHTLTLSAWVQVAELFTPK